MISSSLVIWLSWDRSFPFEAFADGIIIFCKARRLWPTSEWA